MSPDRIIVPDLPALAARAAEWIAERLGAAVARQGCCALALTGGSTPRPVYLRLAERAGVPWPSVAIYFGDERAVPPDHPESNYRLAVETLLAHVPVPAAQIHRMEAERPDRDQAARDYEALLPEPLDVLLLGMGADGHIASLFPHSTALRELNRRVLPTSGGTPLLPRLTITPPVIRSAKEVLVMVTGAEKAESVARTLSGPADPTALPARLARGGVWVLDREAARELPGW